MGRKRKSVLVEAALPTAEKPLGRILLDVPHSSKTASESFKSDDARLALVQKYVATLKRLPTKEQLQVFAYEQGTPLNFKIIAPLLKDFRAMLLRTAVDSKVIVADSCGTEAPGTLQTWVEKNELWSLVLLMDGNQRVNFSFACQPIIEVSDAYVAWLRAE